MRNLLWLKKCVKVEQEVSIIASNIIIVKDFLLSLDCLLFNFFKKLTMTGLLLLLALDGGLKCLNSVFMSSYVCHTLLHFEILFS